MNSVQTDLLKKLGIKVGHYTDKINITGLTTFISNSGADIGIDIRGQTLVHLIHLLMIQKLRVS